MAKRIDISDLKIFYGDFLAVEDVSMVVEPKSVTAFIGPSGCGKSTFLRTLNRMHEVIPKARVEGKVLMDGQDLYEASVDPVQVRRQIGELYRTETDAIHLLNHKEFLEGLEQTLDVCDDVGNALDTIVIKNA